MFGKHRIGRSAQSNKGKRRGKLVQAQLGRVLHGLPLYRSFDVHQVTPNETRNRLVDGLEESPCPSPSLLLSHHGRLLKTRLKMYSSGPALLVGLKSSSSLSGLVGIAKHAIN